MTVTSSEHDDAIPDVSVAVQVTLVVPTGNLYARLVLLGVHTVEATATLSVAVTA